MFEAGLSGWLFSTPAERQSPLRRVPSPLPGVQLWQIDLDAPLRAQAVACLDAGEMQRAGRVRRDRDRQRFIGGRVWLKHLLARTAGCSIDEVVLSTGAEGKPQMLLPDPELTFNISRSAHRALIAIARGLPVGLDLEQWRPIPDASLLAEEHFDAEERASWAQVPLSQRDRAFLRLWVRKEACLKAWGVGLGLDPSRVSVGLETAERRVDAPDPALGGALQVVSLTLQDNSGFEAALSLGATEPAVACSLPSTEH